MKQLIKIMALCLILAACAPKYSRFETGFTDLFDTYTEITGYARSKREFDGYADVIYTRLVELHQKFDIYNSYDGLNNLKTINDNAGGAPVTVDGDIIELLKFGIKAHEETNGSVNIMLGPVLKIWHEYRAKGINNPESAKLPDKSELEAASLFADIEGLIIDGEAKTARLSEKGMSLDVGAVAKGFAVELAAGAAKNAGMTSALINVGGNIRALGKPADESREHWSIGVQDPVKIEDGEIFDTVLVKDLSVVTSGNYQRYYTVNDKTYNHVIDPETLMPSEKFASVTVIAADSKIADMLSTCLFILPFEEGLAVISKTGGEAVWIMNGGEAKMTEGYKIMSNTFGGNGSA